MGSTNTTYASSIGYAPHHAISSLPLGDGLTETWNYNPRLQPASIQAGSLLTLNFGYNSTTNNGNLLSQAISGSGISGITQNYTYDGFNRLSTFTETGGTANQNYSYDNFGNRWISSGWTPYAAQTPTTNTYSNNRWAPSGGVGYDTAGNLTSLLISSSTWESGDNDPLHRLAKE